MLIIFCDKCGKELHQPGALVFSPPWADKHVSKWHLCRACFDLFVDWLNLKKIKD